MFWCTMGKTIKKEINIGVVLDGINNAQININEDTGVALAILISGAKKALRGGTKKLRKAVSAPNITPMIYPKITRMSEPVTAKTKLFCGKRIKNSRNASKGVGRMNVIPIRLAKTYHITNQTVREATSESIE